MTPPSLPPELLLLLPHADSASADAREMTRSPAVIRSFFTLLTSRVMSTTFASPAAQALRFLRAGTSRGTQLHNNFIFTFKCRIPACRAVPAPASAQQRCRERDHHE